jgi:toluene monooxygenase system protein E
MKTWSELGDLGRKPTQYEIVTHGMNHTGGGRNLEMGPDVQGNVWLREHRDSIGTEVDNWDAFRDPDEMTYERYVVTQDVAESYIDAVIARFDEQADSDADRTDAQLDYLARCVTPTRYLSHGQQMLSAYVQQLAPGSYVANCASFQTADQLRRTQRIAERTKMLQLAHPSRGFGDAERAVWENDASWQPVRRLCEQALVRFDWDQALVATNLVFKPLCDQLFLAEAAAELHAIGNELDALIAENLFIDAQRSQRWTSALVRFLGDSSPANTDVIAGHVAVWQADAATLIDSAAALLATAGSRSAAEIGQSATAAWHNFLAGCGVSG